MNFLKYFGFGLNIISIGLYIFGLFGYWRIIDDTYYDDNTEYRFKTFYGFFRAREIEIENNQVVSDEHFYGHFIYRDPRFTVYTSSFVFLNLALLSSILSTVCYILTFIGIIYKPSKHCQRFSIIGKYVLFFSTIFGLISVLIFAGYGDILKRWCKENDINCTESFYEVYSDEYSKTYRGPGLGWILTTFGVLISLIGSIINYKSNIFKRTITINIETKQ